MGKVEAEGQGGPRARHPGWQGYGKDRLLNMWGQEQKKKVSVSLLKNLGFSRQQ